jgi:DMSO/TMAO reductase YedYZ molybdopterin-dependent catalytic subunit
MLTRRSFLGTAALAACSPTNTSKESSSTLDTALPADEPIPPITSVEDFYVQSYSSSPDESFKEDWTLFINGLVEQDLALSLEDLKALGSEEFEHTLECIGNSSERAIGNALWRGVRLSTVLEAAKVKAEAGYLFFRCGDAYTTSVPLSDAGNMWLVFEINGVALPQGHGWPVRVITPGRYGMKNPKWIESIELIETSQAGTWESVGWSDDCTYKIHSWIHRPGSGTVIAAEGGWVRGSAYAGSRGIGKVEYSLDGEDWVEAAIIYGGQANVWALWEVFLVPPAGEFTMWVRATTLDGEVQVEKEKADVNLDGWEGIDSREFGG